MVKPKGSKNIPLGVKKRMAMLFQLKGFNNASQKEAQKLYKAGFQINDGLGFWLAETISSQHHF